MKENQIGLRHSKIAGTLRQIWPHLVAAGNCMAMDSATRRRTCFQHRRDRIWVKNIWINVEPDAVVGRGDIHQARRSKQSQAFRQLPRRKRLEIP